MVIFYRAAVLRTLSMSASEYVNECNNRYFSVCQEWKHKKWTSRNCKKENLNKKLEKKSEQFYNIYIVVFALHVFIFFFHLKHFSLLLCFKLSSFSLSSRHKSHHQRWSRENTVLIKCAKFTGKQPALEQLFNKVAGLKTWNFIKKRVQHRCFPVNIGVF